MFEATSRKITPLFVLGIIGMGLGSLVFLGGIFIGMETDPRVDMAGRLVAYTLALAGLSGIFASRWILATGDFDRKFSAVATILTFALTIVYAAVYLVPRL